MGSVITENIEDSLVKAYLYPKSQCMKAMTLHFQPCTNIKWKFHLLKFFSGHSRALLLTLSEGGVVHNPSL